jgi:ribosomal protein L11 methyltransferase
MDEAFGDGSHPTTRLCAGAVDLLCRLNQPRSVLDVGTGTGILARIARARGVSYIVATDIDPIAITSAQTHIQFDRSTTSIELSTHLPDHWGPKFDLVVANILEGTLKMLAQNLTKAVSPGGLLLLSGFTPAQIPSLRTAFTSHGMKWKSTSTLDEWSILVFIKDEAQ